MATMAMLSVSATAPVPPRSVTQRSIRANNSRAAAVMTAASGG